MSYYDQQHYKKCNRCSKIKEIEKDFRKTNKTCNRCLDIAALNEKRAERVSTTITMDRRKSDSFNVYVYDYFRRLGKKLLKDEFNEIITHLKSIKNNPSSQILDYLDECERKFGLDPKNYKINTYEMEEIEGVKIAKYKGGKPTKPIIQYDMEWNELNRFSSLSEAAAALGKTPGNLSGAIRKKKQCYGFLWKYANE